MNDIALATLACIAMIAFMEGVAWTMHRYLMHGPLWFIHQTHHMPSKRWLELNDVFGIVFAAASMVLLHLGRDNTSIVFGSIPFGPILFGMGLGLMGYGIIYFMLHDVLVHRRIPHRFTPHEGYLARIVQAHHLHHVTRQRDGAVSFGFIFAPSPERLRRMLASRQAADATTGGAIGSVSRST